MTDKHQKPTRPRYRRQKMQRMRKLIDTGYFDDLIRPRATEMIRTGLLNTEIEAYLIECAAEATP